MEENTTKKHWHDNTALVIILTIAVFPIGLYGLYKNKTLKPKAKWGIFAVWAIFVIIAGNISEQKIPENVNASQKSQQFVPDTLAIDNLTQEEKELIEKYHIKLDRYMPPKRNPLWIRERVMEYIKNDFDRNFLSSLDLSIYDASGDVAEFSKKHTYIDPRTGKEKRGKIVYRSFKVLSGGTVQEDDGIRSVYKWLKPPEYEKANLYSLELREKMYNEHRFNKQEWERLSSIDFKRRLEAQKQAYIEMVQEYSKNN